MMERTLHSRSFSLVRNVDEADQETSFVETEANNASQVTELNRTIVEVNEDINSVTDRQVRAHSDSSNNVAMSADQFHKFMSSVRNKFDDLTLKLLMLYIYGAPILDVSRSHTMTQHSR